MVLLVAGAYELKKPVGQGPHGTVWHARHHGTGEHVAVKVLDPALAADPVVVNRFVRDESALTAFLDDGYVRLQRLIVDEGLALVTELVRGVDLETGLRHRARLSTPTAVGVAAECARILAAGHRMGVVHGDVKPRNLLLVGKDRQVRITDCRVARLVRRHAGDARPNTDPRPVAPELLLNHPATPATDVYGIGLLLLAMLTGEALWGGWDGGSPPPDLGYHQRLAQTVSEQRLWVILAACLAEDPQRRPSAAELARQLTEVLDTSPARATRPVPWTPPPEEHVSGAAPPEDPPTHTSLDRPQVQPAGGGPPHRGTVPSTHRVFKMCALAVAVAVGGAAWAGLSWHHGGQATGAARPRAGDGQTTQSSLAAAVAPPQLSGDAAAQTADGARIVARYWFDALNFAMASGNTTLLGGVSGSACDACTALEQNISVAYRSGGSILGGRYVIRSLNPDGFFDLQRATFRLVFDRSTRTTVDGAGHTLSTFAGEAFASCQVILQVENGQWRVVAVQASSPIG